MTDFSLSIYPICDICCKCHHHNFEYQHFDQNHHDIWSWSWNWNPAAASLWASKCQPALRVCNIAIIFIFNLHHHQSVYDYQSVESFSKCAKLLTLITTNHSLQTHQKNCDCLAIITLESTKWECSEIFSSQRGRQPYWGPMYKSKFSQFLPDANTNARFKPEQPEPKRDLKTSQELRMLSPSLCIQRSQCNCSYCCSQLSEM